MKIPINLPQWFKLFHGILGKTFHMEKYPQPIKCKASYYHPTQAPNNAAALELSKTARGRFLGQEGYLTYCLIVVPDGIWYVCFHSVHILGKQQ